MQLDKVVPFGRSLDEYRRIFNLSDSDLCKPILSVADGPASFNAEMHAMGYSVISIDPVYAFSAEEIETQFYAVVDNIIGQVKANVDAWDWSYHKSPENLRSNRIKVLHRFLQDFNTGKRQGRYRNAKLPELDNVSTTTEGAEFGLCLCSHFLFLYSDHLDYDFHRNSLFKLISLVPEVRVYPLITLDRKVSPYLQALLDELCDAGYDAKLIPVEYRLQRGADKMLCIQRRQTEVLN